MMRKQKQKINIIDFFFCMTKKERKKERMFNEAIKLM